MEGFSIIMKKALWRILMVAGIVIAILFGLSFLPNRLATRSGVTDAQVAEVLPGDDILQAPLISIDRAATLPVPASIAWPWIEQLGDKRGGWYAPRWLENTLHLHSASTTHPEFENLKVGQIVPDFGGGHLEVLAVDPYKYVLYGSVIGPVGQNVPQAGPTPAASPKYRYTWAFILENNTPTSTSFHVRFRAPKSTKNPMMKGSMPGFVDYAADAVMFDGLKEKLGDQTRIVTRE